MLSKRSNSDKGRDELRRLGSQFVFTMTLIINIVTTIGVCWIIVKLNLDKDLDNIKQEIEEKPGGELSFKQSLSTDRLMIQEILRTKSITGEQILLSGSDNTAEPQAEIYLDQNYLSMQAKSYRSNTGKEYSFQMPKLVEELHVPSGIKNVRAIRASAMQITSLSNNRTSSGTFEITSRTKLELSGNMNVKVHSQKVRLASKERITIQSKEDTITILAGRGLILPSIPQERSMMSNPSEVLANGYEPGRSWMSDVPEKSQLCINKDDGMIYKAVETC